MDRVTKPWIKKQRPKKVETKGRREKDTGSEREGRRQTEAKKHRQKPKSANGRTE